MMKKRVLVGLSGGVDSAVAAYLLKEEGYDVVGCFMRNWDAMVNDDYLGNPTINDDMCPQEVDYQDALIVSEILNIPLLRVDFVKEYWDDVFTYFLDEFKKGRTPNPDLFCNKYIKFDAFLKFAKKHDFALIAMGHYVDVRQKDGHYFLKKATDLSKDQSYFLSQLSEEQIKSCLFPLGNITKKEVREIAKKLKLHVASKKDSTGICFIGERHFKDFLKNYLPAKQGEIINFESGEVLGFHQGAMYYTIGQHRGLGVGGIKNTPSRGWYVVKKDVQKNIVYVVNGANNKHLYATSLIIDTINEYPSYDLDQKQLNAKFRYRQNDVLVSLEKRNDQTIKVTFLNKQKSLAPGQAAVFYDGDLLVGSGIIKEVYFNETRIDQ